MKKVIILDRDGVINHDSDNYIKSCDEWHIIDGSANAIARLNNAGYTCVVATNQSGIGRGLYSLETFMQICNKMNEALANAQATVEFILYCPHTPEDNCNCRKPKTGMLDETIARLRVESSSVFFIGDTLRDIQAAYSAKIKPILVRTGKGEALIAENPPEIYNVPVYSSLADFADKFLEKKVA